MTRPATRWAGNRIAEHDDTGAVIREYIWLDGRPPKLGVAVVEGGQTYQLHWDQIGRPAMATDSSGAVVWAASYLPFGGIDLVWFDTGVLTQNLRFPGQWFQAETGLHQNGMRDYDPTTGRYLQADPLGLVDGPSVYGYVRQGPLRYTDPTGEFLDIILDAGFIIYDLIRLGIDGECGREENLAALAADIAGAALPFATGLGLAVRAGSRAGKVTKRTTQSGIGVTQHSVQQKINRQVRSADELDEIRSPLDVGPVKFDKLGRPSQRSIGRKAEVVRNPKTGDIVSVNPTSTKKAERLLRRLGGQ